MCRSEVEQITMGGLAINRGSNFMNSPLYSRNNHQVINNTASPDWPTSRIHFVISL